MGDETKIQSALNLSAAITASQRNGEKLGEIHARMTRQDEQLDRVEKGLEKLVALREDAEKRLQQKVESRHDLISKGLAVLKNPALYAAVAGGSLSLGGSELCASARSHQAAEVEVEVEQPAVDAVKED